MHDKDSLRRTRRLLLAGLTGAPALLTLPRRGFGFAISSSPSPAALTADQVLNVADFEALARAKLPPAHWGYLATGVDDDRTVSLNHEAYSHIQIRSRRFVDVSKLDTQRDIFGSCLEATVLFLGDRRHARLSPGGGNRRGAGGGEPASSDDAVHRHLECGRGGGGRAQSTAVVPIVRDGRLAGDRGAGAPRGEGRLRCHRSHGRCHAGPQHRDLDPGHARRTPGIAPNATSGARTTRCASPCLRESMFRMPST